MREIVLAPLVGIRRRQLLAAPVQAEQHHRDGQGPARQSSRATRPTSPSGRAPRQQARSHQPGQPGVGEAAAGGVFHELRVDQVCQVATVGQPPDSAHQLCRRHPECRPGQQHRQCQPPRPAVQQQQQEAAEGQVRQVAERIGPPQEGARSQGDHQHQGCQGDEPSVRVAELDIHENFP
ncbi:hypothetical protein D3C76_1130380 [compost metagenome]